jgi:tRNA threonylcarbamoyladenosine biosynthesis protein TsaE
VPAPLVVVTRSPEETRRLGAALGRALEPLGRTGTTVALLGDLGAGKTVLVTGLARGLGVPEEVAVASPTFTVARGYRGRVPVRHLDAYLLRSLAELEAAGFDEVGGGGGVTVVEWGDRIAEALPADRLEVTLVLDPDAAPPSPEGPPRRVTIEARGPRSAEALARLRASLSAAAAT